MGHRVWLAESRCWVKAEVGLARTLREVAVKTDWSAFATPVKAEGRCGSDAWVRVEKLASRHCVLALFTPREVAASANASVCATPDWAGGCGVRVAWRPRVPAAMLGYRHHSPHVRLRSRRKRVSLRRPIRRDRRRRGRRSREGGQYGARRG